MSLINIVNELVVSDVASSIKFYEDNFGFVTEFVEGTPITWAQIKKDNIIIMLEDYNEVKNEIVNYPQKSNSSNLIMFEYSSVEEVKDLYNSLKENRVDFFANYTETDYGKVEFGICDLDNNMILISASIKKN